MISTVKIQSGGYLVNGALAVPNATGNRHYQEVQVWIADGNTPEPEFTQGELDARAEKVEIDWAMSEKPNVQEQLDRISDGEGITIGTPAAWRAYRKLLRAHVNGPRPDRPT